ncbi:class I SAM-dependent DNA methyltransferase [Limosilactobacillus fermentum]
MNATEQRKQAKLFVDRWKDRGDEKQDSQQFWMDLLEHVYGVEDISSFIRFEDRVKLDHTSFIDGYIDQTKVMIEQKGRKKNLNQAIKQSDGTLLTPFQQAKRYSSELPYSERPRWIITSNFEEFYIYDMEKPNDEPNIVRLVDLGNEFYRLDFMVDQSNEHVEKELQVSIKAGDLVGKIYNALLAQYKDHDDHHSQESINQLCVRLVFCLYAEDAGIFGRIDMFHDYLSQFETRDIRRALVQLFKILDTKVENRDPYLADDDPKLVEFPYVNGGMFADEDIEIPPFTDELRDLLLNSASEGFDWSDISPTIFGAVFESTLNPDTRRSGGMHYTSLENIHKVIDPLFLDDLKEELNEIKQLKQPKTILRRAEDYQDKLAGLIFFDPACGSGNFLTETYLSIRKLENEAIKLIYGDQSQLSLEKQIIKVSINQFYGIEINDFAVSVAKTALWIAESQMMEATKDIVYTDIDFLPLKTYTNIIEGNALRIDWESVIKPYQLDYIMGNPPFVGYSLQSESQKEDMRTLYVDSKGKTLKYAGKIDYVAGWYRKACEFIDGTTIQVAFVSTNSITQGEQVQYVWESLYQQFKININFAYRTFRWDSEASAKAHVHVVIIGFSQNENGIKLLFDESGQKQIVSKINPYLLPMATIFISNRSKPIADVPKMSSGNRLADGGHLILDQDEYLELIKEEPKSKQFIKKLTGSEEYIKGKKRYCLWLVNATPADINSIPLVKERVRLCREDRLKGAPDRQKLADTPTLFREQKNPKSYILIPSTSSETRKYVPMGFLDDDTIPTNSAQIVPDASLYEFGILTSNVHMAWMRAVAGRLKSDYRYSAKIVYNNFPWPTPTEEQKAVMSV